MEDSQPVRVDDLHDVIDQKILALVREMENGNWSAEEVVLAINDVIKARWLDRMNALHEAANALPRGFVSDGNEG
jgi:hypothetical protein